MPVKVKAMPVMVKASPAVVKSGGSKWKVSNLASDVIHWMTSLLGTGGWCRPFVRSLHEQWCRLLLATQRETCLQRVHSAQRQVHHWWGLGDPMGSMWNGTGTQEGTHRVAADDQGGAGGGGDR